MKESKLVKVILIIIISLIMLLSVKETLAATNGVTDLTNSLELTNSTSNSTTSNSTKSNTTSNTSKSNCATNNTVLTTNNVSNTSKYNNSLPKTGIEDSAPTVVLLIVLGISAIYAYKKIQDYKNI